MFAARPIPYQQTAAFTRIVIDYLNGKEELKPFYNFSPSLEGVEKTIGQKKLQPVERELLVNVLHEQYKTVKAAGQVLGNINSLLSPDTFTVTTAHQPNLFTGPLYFIYKILHAVKLSRELKKELPQYHFV